MSDGQGGSLDQPFEEVPGGPFEMTTDVVIAGGVTYRSAVANVPGHGQLPSVVFTFVLPDGSFLPPIMLVLTDERTRTLGGEITKAAHSAIRATRKARADAHGQG